CELETGERGRCRGRQNIGGKLIATNYGQSIGIGLDPIEKKPLYHFRPGSQILSLGANSCNLSCFFCQNFDSSQAECPTRFISPADLHALVLEHCQKGVNQVAFTYTEPFTWYEYIYDFALLAKDTDIILVTNGFINPQPLKKLLPYVKAMNIDLKSIRPEYYTEHCGAGLETVKQTIRTAHEGGVHIELTNLLIPGLNDSDGDVRALVNFVACLDKDIPLHFSAYHPAYKSRIPATPQDTVLGACKIASESLSYVYAGNIYTSEFRETKCPQCGSVVISAGRRIVALNAEGSCASCSHRIKGVW
ncbi:MAG: AmmeMemoRadiSam system radical SAM enzyme, partial [Candidatus Syntrophosphaera sp.]|nr:AmmeMemoRadiSam system radical SAM enzyme [Candidatus Syntrophosphaera sp.]